MLYADISQTIGRTPVVRINRLAPQHVQLYVKLEAANPAGDTRGLIAAEPGVGYRVAGAATAQD